MDPIISVVIPLHCEGSHLSASVTKVASVLDTLDKSYEIVLVDDGSSDDTWSEIERISERVATVTAVRFSRNFGKEAAISAGLKRAAGRAVIVMDGDLQHPPELIPDMVALWEQPDVDVVDAVKKSRATEALPYKICAQIFGFLMWKFSGFDLRGSSDFKLLDRKVVNAWLEIEENSVFYRGMTEWLGFSHKKIEFNVAERVGGRSAWSFLRLVRLGTTAITSFSSAPLHMVTFIGILFLLAASALGAWTIYRWIEGTSVSGFTTVIMLQLIIGSFLMISLGVIGEFLSSTFYEAKRRPRYIVAEAIARGNSPDENGNAK